MTSNVTMTVMTNTPVSYTTASWVMSPVSGLPFNHLTNNLGLIIASTPPDFFDDWSVPIQNFANVARAARDAGLKGLCIDNEQYFAPWGNYPEGVLYYPAKSLGEYLAQARLRGKQVMEAMVAQFPGIVVLTLHGPYISEFHAPALFPQVQAWNELLGPFFAGFMEGKGSLAQNVDGGELYDLRSTAEFLQAYDWRKTAIASEGVDCPFIPAADRPSWPSQTSIGFGVYDRPSGGHDMNPAILETTLVNALNQSDRWVWFYVEGPSFLIPVSQGGAGQAWIDAVRQAKIEAGSGPTPPASPSNLQAGMVSNTAVTLTWTDGSSDENGFSIERLIGTAWTQVGYVADNVTTYPDVNLSPASLYQYRVLAFNGAGNSATTNELGVTTLPDPAGQIPGAPTQLAGSAISSSEVVLTWTDGSSNENGFSIERQIRAAWVQVGYVPDNVTTYLDSGLSPRTYYHYRVLAFNGAGNSAPTNEVLVGTRR